jgi:ribosome-associated toxin RatA of RatAB toxin-antitoxin module
MYHPTEKRVEGDSSSKRVIYVWMQCVDNSFEYMSNSWLLFSILLQESKLALKLELKINYKNKMQGV